MKHLIVIILSQGTTSLPVRAQAKIIYVAPIWNTQNSDMFNSIFSIFCIQWRTSKHLSCQWWCRIHLCKKCFTNSIYNLAYSVYLSVHSLTHFVYCSALAYSAYKRRLSHSLAVCSSAKFYSWYGYLSSYYTYLR